jgi:hypothetical protein
MNGEKYPNELIIRQAGGVGERDYVNVASILLRLLRAKIALAMTLLQALTK